MESIGEKLRLAREKNNLTIEQIARETHVARRFLKALEEEDFSAFPGETYAMGFLRSYSEYLGLNAEEMVGLYRNLKIQEQPLPMNELLKTGPALSMRLILIIAAAAVLVLGGGGFALWRLAGRGGTGEAGQQSASLLKRDSSDFVFQEEVRTKWFTQGDVISVPLSGRSYRVEISSIGDALTLRVPGRTVELTLGKELFIDLDEDSQPDLRIVWNDNDRTSVQKRVNLGLYRVSASSAAVLAADGGHPSAAPQTADAASEAPAASTPAAAPAGSPTPTAASAATPATATPATATPATAAPATAAPAAAAPAAAVPAAAAPAAATARSAGFKTAVVAASAETSEFTMDLSFRDYCFFRFLVDENEKEERFFQKGESFRLDAKAAITLWLSNAGAVKARIGGKDLDLGRLGEVATRQIAWRKDAVTGDYVLEIAPIY